MLTYYHQDILKYLLEYSGYQSLSCVWNLAFEVPTTSPRGQWVNHGALNLGDQHNKINQISPPDKQNFTLIGTGNIHISTNTVDYHLVIIGADNGLSPIQDQVICWTNHDLFSVDPWEHTSVNLFQIMVIFIEEIENVICVMSTILHTHHSDDKSRIFIKFLTHKKISQ